jgi:large subunit ribosomal protein L25
MAQTVSLSANPRQTTGKGAARQARFRGKVPAVIYGHGRETQPLELESKALEKALQGIEPASTIIELAVDGKTVKTLIREIQRHPIRPDIIHVDFYEIHASEKVKLKIPVHLVGNPDGVRNAGGVLDQVTREVEIEVLPENIPERVELDVNALKIGDSLHVRDLSIPNAKILTDADLTIATVVPPRAEEVATPTPETATEVAEPELIRKVREEEEEGEAATEGGAPSSASGTRGPSTRRRVTMRASGWPMRSSRVGAFPPSAAASARASRRARWRACPCACSNPPRT